MSNRSTSLFRGGVIAVAASIATFGLSTVARDWFNVSPTPMILGGLIIAAWYGGLWPGLVYCVLTDVAVDYAFGDPRWELTPDPVAHFVRLIVLCTVSVIISSLRSARDRLEVRAKEQEAVAEFGRSALAGTDLPDLLLEAADKVTRVLNVKSSAICRVDLGSDKMVFAAVHGWSQDLAGKSLNFHENGSLAGLVAGSEEPVIVNDINKNSSFRVSELLEAENVRSMAGARIVSRDGLYGVLGAFDTSPREFSKDDINFLQSISNVIAEAVDRLSKEAEISQQRTWLQTTLTSIGDGVIATDAEGKVIFLNKVAQALTGWDEESAKGRKLKEVYRIINESNRQEVSDPVASVFRSGKVLALADPTILLAKDGREIPIEDSAAPITDGNEVKGVVLVFSDVSERKRSQRLVVKRTEEIAALYTFTDKLQRSHLI